MVRSLYHPTLSRISRTLSLLLLVVVLFLLLCWLDTTNGEILGTNGTKNSLASPSSSTGISGDDESKKPKKILFHLLDYVILGAMLIVSCAIGIFYGFCSKKQETGQDFLLGGSNMGTLPMSLSLAASFITAVELLGNPSEMYQYGTQYWMICFAFIFAVPITSTFYLPVFMKLRLTSSFEYLEKRFNEYVRYLASFLYVIQMCLYTSVTVYAPALALHNATDVDVYTAVTLVYVVCIFYSSQGGMKAVIMTDTFQAIILTISLFVVAIVGTCYYSENLYEIFRLSSNSSRIEFFNFDFSLTSRTTLWTQLIGGTFYWVSMFASNQASLQKYLSVESIGQVRTALWVSAFGLILIYTVNFYTGMILFANYYKNDPLNAGEIRKEDEILPYYVINSLSGYGIPGLFVAGIFAASLGTVASTLNSLAAVVMKDFLNKMFGLRVSVNKEATLSKCLSIAFGVLSFAFVFIVQRFRNVLKAALTFNGLVGGITLGLFSLGMFLPRSNSKGSLVGALTSLALSSWIGIGTLIAESGGYKADMPKPVYNSSIDEFVQSPLISQNNDEPCYLYRISLMWYSAIGFVTTVVIGSLFSWITGFNDRVDPDLISPIIQRLYKQSPPNDVKEKLHLPLEKTSIDIVASSTPAVAECNAGENLRLMQRKQQPREEVPKKKTCLPSFRLLEKQSGGRII